MAHQTMLCLGQGRFFVSHAGRFGLPRSTGLIQRGHKILCSNELNLSKFLCVFLHPFMHLIFVTIIYNSLSLYTEKLKLWYLESLVTKSVTY
jgi:hypothetical protein